MADTAPAARAEGELPPLPEGVSEDEVMAKGNEILLQLHTAAKAGKVEEMQELLNKNANMANMRDRETFSSALHVAARSGHAEAVRLLLRFGASPVLPDKDGLTPLDHARVRHRTEVLEELWTHVKQHPPPIKQCGPLVSSLFESPCRRADMEWALSHYGPLSLLDVKGRDLRTPLHFAITQDDTQLIHRLLDLGADAFVRDRFGQSPLDLAKSAGQGEAALAIARNMQIQVVAFVCVMFLFYVYRNLKQPQLAWSLAGVLYPSVKTLHVLFTSPSPAALAEWLTYWGVMGPVVMVETLLAHDYLQQCTLWQQLLTSVGLGKGSGGVEVLVLAKIAATLYLVYPASRGARVLYQKAIAPIASKHSGEATPGEGGKKKEGKGKGKED